MAKRFERRGGVLTLDSKDLVLVTAGLAAAGILVFILGLLIGRHSGQVTVVEPVEQAGTKKSTSIASDNLELAFEKRVRQVEQMMATSTAATGDKTVAPVKSSTSRPSAHVVRHDVQKGPWTLQVAAFADRKRARKEKEKWTSSGYEPHIFNAGSGKLPYKVRIGGFVNRRDADVLMKRVKNVEKVTGWVVKE